MVLAQHFCIVCNLGAEQNGFGPTFLHSLQRLVNKAIATKSLPATAVRERVYNKYALTGGVPYFWLANQNDDDWPRWFAISTHSPTMLWLVFPVFDWQIRLMIGPGGLLLVLSNYLQSLLVGGGGLEKWKITKLGCEKYYNCMVIKYWAFLRDALRAYG